MTIYASKIDPYCISFFQSVPNAATALRGYDLFIANRFMQGESDPGMRHQIFNPSFIGPDGRVQLHTNLDMFDSLHCSKISKGDVVTNYMDYRRLQIGDFQMKMQDEYNFNSKIPVLPLIASVSTARSKFERRSRNSHTKDDEALFTQARSEVYISSHKCETQTFTYIYAYECLHA